MQTSQYSSMDTIDGSKVERGNTEDKVVVLPVGDEW